MLWGEGRDVWFKVEHTMLCASWGPETMKYRRQATKLAAAGDTPWHPMAVGIVAGTRCVGSTGCGPSISWTLVMSADSKRLHRSSTDWRTWYRSASFRTRRSRSMGHASPSPSAVQVLLCDVMGNPSKLLETFCTLTAWWVNTSSVWCSHGTGALETGARVLTLSGTRSARLMKSTCTSATDASARYCAATDNSVTGNAAWNENNHST